MAGFQGTGYEVAVDSLLTAQLHPDTAHIECQCQDEEPPSRLCDQQQNPNAWDPLPLHPRTDGRGVIGRCLLLSLPPGHPSSPAGERARRGKKAAAGEGGGDDRGPHPLRASSSSADAIAGLPASFLPAHLAGHRALLHHLPSPFGLGTTMTDDPSAAYAACAHLGRTCPPGCPLARYFPAAGDQPD
uniref:LOB domain-containing protein n=1 Tax=Oryza glumipatula TaxID=40148 RepID=A0A0D9ZQX6_9ORYZ